MKTKNFKLLPIAIVYFMVACCWYQLSKNNYEPTIKHILALMLIIINTGIYFWNFNKGIFVTGVFLLIASCSLISIEAQIITHSFSYQIGALRISSPSINYTSFLLLILYCILNYSIIKLHLKKINNWLKSLPR